MFNMNYNFKNMSVLEFMKSLADIFENKVFI